MAKRFRPPEEDVESELNLVPYLDIMINLIMFMLFSTTGLTQMGVINISLPQYGGAPVVDTGQPTPAPEDVAELSLAVSEQGFTVLVNGAEVSGKENEPTIKRQGDRYDFEALTRQMDDLKSTYPGQSTMLLTAGEAVRYEVIIDTMDAIREVIIDEGASNRILFPDVVLGAFGS